MKMFDAIFTCAFPEWPYPNLLDIENVPIDYFPYLGIADNKEVAKSSLLTELSNLTSSEIWKDPEEYHGFYRAKIEIIDEGDYFYLKVCKDSVIPIKLKWLEEIKPDAKE